MKSIKKKFSIQKQTNESTQLITETAPRYTGQLSKDALIKEEENPRFEMETAATNEKTRKHSSLSSSPTTPTSPTFETEFYPPKKKEPSWVSEARKQSTQKPLLDSDNDTFCSVDVTVEDSLRGGVWQSIFILVLFLFIPSVILALVGFLLLKCFVMQFQEYGKSANERKRKARAVFFTWLACLVFSIFKDLVIAVVAVSFYNSTLSCYEIVYPLVILLVLVIFVLFPMMVYAFSEVTYEYDQNGQGKTNKPETRKEKEIASKFMENHLSALHEVKNIKDQAFLLRRTTSKCFTMVSMLLFFVLCASRGFVQWFLNDTLGTDTVSTNVFANMSTRNVTLDSSIEDRVGVFLRVVSSFNTFFWSMSISMTFSIAFAWVSSTFRMWRSFLADMKSKDGLLTKGIVGITAWWRVYQYLIFFTSSSRNPFVLLRVALSATMACFSITLSSLLLALYSSNRPLNVSAYLMAIDNILLICAIFLFVISSLLIANIKQEIVRELGLLKLRMACQSYSTDNDFQPGEGEYQANLKRFKSRNLRSSLQLMKELYIVMANSSTDIGTKLSCFIYLLVIILGLISVSIS